MKKTKRALWIFAALSAAVLVPLYGDPRLSPVTHAEWARMMVRGLGFEDSLQGLESADDIFQILAWRDQLNFPASKYKRATGVATRGEFVDAGPDGGEVAYDLPVVRSGDYDVRLRLQGTPDKPFRVEIRKDGQVDAVETQHPTGSGSEYTTVDLGLIRMEPGNHTLSVTLPPGTSLESIQVSPPCLSPIEPENGWRAPALTTDEDLAHTLLQALEMEGDLPPADDPIEIRAGRFDVLAPDSAIREGSDESEDFEIRATSEGLHAVVHADLPRAGLYALSAWTVAGAGQTWLADSCRRADICPTEDPAAKWRPVLTSEFNAGPHSFAVLLGSGAVVGRIRLQRLKTTPEDYVATLKRVGFDVGPKGPITRDTARQAMEWLRDRWKKKLAESCLIQTLLGRLTAGGQVAGGQAGTGIGITPPGSGPVGPPSPPTGPPTGPPLLPPPPPINPQPPATPVLPVR